MIPDAIKEITGLLDRRFLVYVYLPVIGFFLALAAVWSATHQGLARTLDNWRDRGTLQQILAAAAILVACFVVATIFAAMLTALTRLYEGYWTWPPLKWLAAQGRGWHQRRVRTNEVQLHGLYPSRNEIDQVMPTLLGNVLKEAERYPADRYGINSLVIWPRLYELFPTNYLEAIAGTRAELEFLLLIATLSASFGVTTGIYFIVIGTAWWLFLLCLWGGFAFAWVCYRGAVSTAQLCGIQVKVGFDLYRESLARQLGLPTPATVESETTVWEQVNDFLYQGVPPTSPDRPTPPLREPEPELETLPRISLARKGFVFLIALGLAGVFAIVVRNYLAPDSSRVDSLVIIQLNDTYRIDAVENGEGGGFSRVATLLKQTKAEDRNVMLVHAGDFIAPSLESRFFHGQQMIDALNYLGTIAPLYAVPGNHEFDDADPATLAGAINRSTFTWVCSNLKLNSQKTDADTRILPHTIVNAGNLRVGFFGLTVHGLQAGGGDQPYAPIAAQDTYIISDAALFDAKADASSDAWQAVNGLRGRTFNSKDEFKSALTQITGDTNKSEQIFAALSDYFFNGYTALAEQEIQRLETEGANVIIGLTHLNITDDQQIAKLRSRHPAFIWIAGGHEHYAQREGLTAGSALITKADSNARTAWKIRVSLKNGTPDISADKITINRNTLALDEKYERDIVDTYHERLKEKMAYFDDPLGTVQQASQNRDRCFQATEEIVRNAHSNWGEFLADRMRHAFGKSEAQIGVLNGGTIRIDDNFCDTIRYEQLERSIGFPTKVVYVELSGSDFKNEILETAVGAKRGDGRFLQTAGVSFEFDRRRNPHDRVFNVQVQKGNAWAPLDLKQKYIVAVSQYMFTCNDGYRFRNFITRYIDNGPDLRALVVKAFGGAKANPVAGAFEAPGYLMEASAPAGSFVPKGNLSQCK